jgi:ADP-ribosyl-[dinitrogen reductase] hydrolase
VVTTLEAGLNLFLQTDSFQDAVLTAANLGGDADTIAAVTGQIAGAYYGVSAIRGDWKARVAMTKKIQDMAQHLFLKSTIRQMFNDRGSE